MGMFDSFFVDVDGHPVELQSKRFDCGLGHYHRGDFVDGALPGVRVFFDELMLDENSTPVYGDKAAEAIQKTAFIVLVEGIFVDDQVHDGALDSTAILAIVQQLKERWSDSARALAFMSEALRQRQYHLRRLRGTLTNVSSIIATARRLRAGETLNERFELLWEENKKLAAGEDPLEVIAWALDQQRTRGFSISEGSQTDPLAEFRL